MQHKIILMVVLVGALFALFLVVLMVNSKKECTSWDMVAGDEVCKEYKWVR